jgi:hypothetical protein
MGKQDWNSETCREGEHLGRLHRLPPLATPAVTAPHLASITSAAWNEKLASSYTYALTPVKENV